MGPSPSELERRALKATTLRIPVPDTTRLAGRIELPIR
jgi:hypothetical protein